MVTSQIASETVTFSADGLQLVGDIRYPVDGHPTPAVALTGPFTGVRDQVTGLYADALAHRGFATLAFDHRGFGASGGRPGHEDSQGKLADLRAAVDVLAARPEVDADRIGVVGVCLGGGYAVRAAATDPRLRAVAGVAGAYNSPAWFADRMGAENYRGALASFIARYDELMPAVAPGGGDAAMGGDEPFAYYGTDRSASDLWRNEVTRGSLHSLMTLDALGAADVLGRTPLLVVHGRIDDYCSPELAVAVHERADGPKELHWVDCERHIDLYDQQPYVDEAVAVVARFLHEHL